MNSDPPQTLSPALPVGYLLKEYSLLSVLGMGSFGITYLAADNYLHLKVAIKEYFPSSAAVRNHFSGSVALKSDQAQAEYQWGKERFMREAQTLARFSHKNIVQVFRYLEGNGTCYMVMAYEEGMSLEQALKEDTLRRDEASTLALLMPLLDGLESVHAAGFLHRDIKPANIVLRANDDGPVLIDFGAARSPASTEALTIVLSHGYGPPEQYSRQSHQGPWTDIYAMAGVLYKIVSGVTPPLSLHRVQNDVMIPATFSGAGRYSAGFLAAIDAALSVDETRRPQSIGEWRQLLTSGTSIGANGIAAASDGARREIRPDGPGASPSAMPPASYADSGTGQANPANGRIAAPGTVGSPGIGRQPATRSGTFQRTRPADHEPGTGILARLGAAMIAHPFLTLVLMAASLFIALHLARRPVPRELPPRPVAPVVAAGSASALPPAESAAVPIEGSRPVPELPRPVPAAGPSPNDEPRPVDNPNDAERQRNRFPAIVACEGKVVGAACGFVDRRNLSLRGSCGVLPNGATVCRPEPGGERGDRPPGPPNHRQDIGQDPRDYRPPR